MKSYHQYLFVKSDGQENMFVGFRRWFLTISAQLEICCSSQETFWKRANTPRTRKFQWLAITHTSSIHNAFTSLCPSESNCLCSLSKQHITSHQSTAISRPNQAKTRSLSRRSEVRLCEPNEQEFRLFLNQDDWNRSHHPGICE
jgi:hypothetical protein